MKGRLLLAALICASLLAAGCSTLPPWKSAPTGQSAVYGKVEDTRTLVQFIAFADDQGVIAIAVGAKRGRTAPRYALLADKPTRDSLHEVFSKYMEWSSTAAEKGVEITKEISTLTVTQLALRGRQWDDAGSRELTFVFTSRFDGSGTQQIFMTMRSSAFFGRGDSVTLSDSQAREFDTFLLDESADKGWDEAKKKQETIDLFK